jgi:hypothetical protein
MSSPKREATWKLQVKDRFFADYAVEFEENNIDILVYPPEGTLFADAFLWAEAKRGIVEVPEMFAQLLLTIKKTVDAGDILPPKFLGVFDQEKIAFLEFHHILPVFYRSDFNWNDKPSHVSEGTVKIVEQFLTDEALIQFNLKNDEQELREFIKANFVIGRDNTSKIQITKNNFVTVFMKWAGMVRPTFDMSYDELAEYGLIDGDFYLGDLLSEDNVTLPDFKNLKVVLKNDCYEINVPVLGKKRRLFVEVHFVDHGKTHKLFWEKYQRPPKEEFRDYMKDRRDLLVPQDIRERKGSFFTPQIWVEKSQEYLEKVFGENWQDEYYIWDCCCGTGNLLAGLVNPHRVWASTIDQADIDILHTSINNKKCNLLESHVFRFDFLDGNFDDLPESLRRVIDDPEKRKKIIVYMNPPYAEGGSSRQMAGTGQYKTDIEKNRTHDKYHSQLAGANREIFAQFLMRIYCEIPDSKIGTFATLKSLAGPHFKEFRSNFKAKLKSLFICPANTFDNVNGQFAIGFFVWDTEDKRKFKKINADIYSHQGNYIGIKPICSYDNVEVFSKWVNTFKIKSGLRLGWLEGTTRNDFQHNSIIFILNDKEQMVISRGMTIFDKNLVNCCVCFAVRKCFKSDWLNNRDQFLYPSDEYKSDKEFQTDCLIYTLFHDKNCMRSYGNENHWIPFSERDVAAKDNFKSTFMSDFLKKRKLSKEAQAVFDAGKALWMYYHERIRKLRTPPVDASLYEIREYFKGRDAQGRMRTKAEDEKFNELDKALRLALKKLAENIQPKVYEYGFLRK